MALCTMVDRGAVALDTADDEGFESADEGRSDHNQSDFVRPESAANSFSDVSLASEGRSNSPVRPLSRLSRQSLAEHHAATNGHAPAAATAIPSWSRGVDNTQQESAVGSLEESIPEMLRIKDLDSGKEYNLDKASLAAARQQLQWSAKHSQPQGCCIAAVAPAYRVVCMLLIACYDHA